MIAIPENMASANKAAVEIFLTLTDTAFAGGERLAALHLGLARSFLEDGLAGFQSLSGVKDPEQFVALQTKLAQPAMEKFAAYSRNLFEIATQAQEEVSQVVEAQFAVLNKNVGDVLDKASRNAPAGTEGAIAAARSAIAASNSAYENISKATRQLVEMAESNLAAATSATVKPSGTTAKARKAA